ncbi:MAG: hypothetical protein RLZZ587_964, partial [Actinomycetota bacterium]
MSGVVENKPRIIGRLIVALAAGVLFAYPFWTALGNLVNLPGYYQDQFGVGSEQVPWFLLVAGVAVPVLIFVGGIIVSWRRGA